MNRERPGAPGILRSTSVTTIVETDGPAAWGVRLLGTPLTFDTVITIFLAVAGWHVGFAKISDNSFFCHLGTGRWILDHGIPRADPFSFTAAGTPWVAESWLADLIYGVLDRSFGPAGVLTLNAAAAAAIAALWYRLALRINRDRIRAFAITMVSLVASFTMWSPRPLLLGILAFLIIVWIVEAPDSFVGQRPLISIPLLIWAWSNLHGTFVLGFVYLGLNCLGSEFDATTSSPRRERQLISASAIAFAFCFVNPYGGRLLIAPQHLLGRRYALNNVTEWLPPAVPSAQALMYTVWVLTFACALIFRFNRIRPRGLVVGVPFLILGFWAERNITVAPIVTFPIVARAFATTEERPPMDIAFNWLAALLALGLAANWTARGWIHPTLDLREYPVAAMQAVESQGLLGHRLLTTDSWGDYIIMRYGPRQPVFMDDRYDVYPASVTSDLEAMLNRRGNWIEVASRYKIDVIVWPSRDPSVRMLELAQGFQNRYEDALAIVLVRPHASADRNVNER
jgi:hypothetical protein